MGRSNSSSGFVYLWYDRKHKRFYLGKHWGSIDDGYVCSSKWMKRAYLRRPEDFRRRILEWVYTDRNDLIDAENRWGSLIKEEELANRYYNLNLPGKNLWHDNPEKKKEVGDKISDILRNMSPEKKKVMYAKQAVSQRGGKKPRVSKALKGRKLSEEHRQNVGNGLKGRILSEETKRKISESRKGQSLSKETKEKLKTFRSGNPLTEEHKQKISEGQKRRRLREKNERERMGRGLPPGT